MFTVFTACLKFAVKKVEKDKTEEVAVKKKRKKSVAAHYLGFGTQLVHKNC